MFSYLNIHYCSKPDETPLRNGLLPHSIPSFFFYPILIPKF